MNNSLKQRRYRAATGGNTHSSSARLRRIAATRKWYKNNRKDALEHNTVFKLYTEKKRIEKQYDEWNDTLRELGYK